MSGAKTYLGCDGNDDNDDDKDNDNDNSKTWLLRKYLNRTIWYHISLGKKVALGMYHTDREEVGGDCNGGSTRGEGDIKDVWMEPLVQRSRRLRGRGRGR